MNPSEQPCIFCSIAAGEAPGKIVATWDDVIAIVPLNPVTPGHLLVIPKRHVGDVTENPGVSAAAMRAAAELATQPCNIITSAGREATQTVFHLHLHVIPRADGDGLALPWTPREPATVFLAWGGEYDERDVRKVFMSKADADAYGCADHVEERKVELGPVETRQWTRAVWTINDPAAPEHMFDMVNPLDFDALTSPVHDYDGKADTLTEDWWLSNTGDGSWVVQFEAWDRDLITAAWKERRGRIVAAHGSLPLPLDGGE